MAGARNLDALRQMPLTDSTEHTNALEPEAHLWIAEPCKGVEAGLLPAWVDLLDTTERGRFERFRFERDRNLYATAHALVRTTISRYVAIAPAQLRFGTTANGKPCLDPAQNPFGLRFNLSHSRGLAACLVARHAEPGVDVEELASPCHPLEIADRYFAASEANALRRMTGKTLRDHFLSLWTLKEALVKATGVGLSLPLDGFAFDIQGESIHVASQSGYDTAEWQFALLRAAPDHVVAAAVRLGGNCAGPLRLQVRRTVPLGQDLTDAGIACIASSGTRHGSQGPGGG